MGMLNINRSIYVTVRFEGIHSYPDAPEEVSYLRYPHRHVFNVRVDISVFHNERDIEFIMFKHDIETFIKSICPNGVIENMSCESFAEVILTYVISTYPNRSVKVEVNEDNENGSILYIN